MKTFLVAPVNLDDMTLDEQADAINKAIEAQATEAVAKGLEIIDVRITRAVSRRRTTVSLGREAVDTQIGVMLHFIFEKAKRSK